MEFLVKNGSERVIDDARSHLSLLKMLRQFHYIDQNGKDQGINVRNRSKELTDLLSDVDRIRSERKKARSTRNKYTGVEGGNSFGAGGSSSSRYGGFGSEEAGYPGGYGGATRGVYGDGGGFGGESHEEYDEGGKRGGAERFDEYDEYDDGGAQAAPSRRRAEPQRTTRTTPKKAAPPKPKEPEVDLFDFGDEPSESVAPLAAPSNGTSSILLPPSAAGPEDDDFDDFQSATPSATVSPPAIAAPNYSTISTAAPTLTTQYAQPAPQQGGQSANFSNIFSTASPSVSSTGTPSNMSAFSPPAQQQSKPAGYQPTGPNYFTSVQLQPGQPSAGMSGNVTSPLGAPASSAAGKKPTGGDAFAALLGGGMKKAGTTSSQKPTMADMAKQKSQAGLYGANAPAAFQQPTMGIGSKPKTGSSGMDDLLG